MRRSLAALLALALALASPSHGAFNDAPESARSSALSGAMTAVTDDPVAALSNPAAVAGLSAPAVTLNYLRQFDIPVSKADQDRFSFVSAVPIRQEILKGAFTASYLFNQRRHFSNERTLAVGYAARSVVETDSGSMDLGMTIKVLGNSLAQGGGSSKGTVDLGGLWRFGTTHALGFSFLNLTQPKASHPDPTAKDKAPFAAKLGFAEALRGFLLVFDLTARTKSTGNSGTSTFSAGLERWWSTARAGSYAVRGGLMLGAASKTASAGVGWRVLGGEASYGFMIPMQGANVAGHSVSMAFRFGASDPEREYERVLSDEIKYRRDLTQALESSEAKQWRLGEELNRLREELNLLRDQLVDKTASEAQARQRIRDLEQRRKDAEERFSSLQVEQKRLAERSQQSLFDEDWNAYIKQKLGGAPDAVLVEQVKRILRQYKDKGVDLSAANQELVRLLRAK